MWYRSNGDTVFDSNFTVDEYVRYVHNLNIIHLRYTPDTRDTQLILIPTDVTEDSDSEDGYMMSFVIKMQSKGVDVSPDIKYLKDVSQRAANINKWLVTDLSRGIRYKDMYMPAEWIQRVAPKILTNQQSIDDNYLVNDMPDVTGWLTKETIPKWIEVSSDDIDIEYSVWEENDLYLEDTFITDLQKGDPRRTINEIYASFIDVLWNLYTIGTIGEVNDTFIANWELVEDTVYRGLYHPLWMNTLVAPVQSKYLLDAVIKGKPESYASVIEQGVFDFYGKPLCL